eukprot:g33429.t1
MCTRWASHFASRFAVRGRSSSGQVHAWSFRARLAVSSLARDSRESRELHELVEAPAMARESTPRKSLKLYWKLAKGKLTLWVSLSAGDPEQDGRDGDGLVRLAPQRWWLILLLPLSAETKSSRAVAPRKLEAQYLDIEGTPDMSLFNDEAQIARSMAQTLSEDITPAHLLSMLRLNLRQSQAVFGSCIAFEPDSYPWRNGSNGSVKPDAWDLRWGVPSGNANGSVWTNASDPWTLPTHEVWPGEHRVLYAPYVARGNIKMDLSNGYNYYAPDVEWYHAARTKYLTGELPFLEGIWGSPYFDEGAGNIRMVTFSVPFTRESPVPSFSAPEHMEKPHGLPPNLPRQTTRNGERYFWGIATVDIDLSIIRFRCGAGEAQGTNFSCKECEEYEYSTDDRSDCKLNLNYLLYAASFHLWLALMATHENEGGLVLHLCNKHGIHVSANRKSQIEAWIRNSGHVTLDQPEREKSAEIKKIKEFTKIGGYVCFGLGWEIVTWLLVPLALAVGTLLLWIMAGLGVFMGLSSTLAALALWVMIIVASRIFWMRSARHKQVKRKMLLNEEALVEKLAQSCWEADQQMEHEARQELTKHGWTESDFEELTNNMLKRQSQDTGAGRLKEPITPCTHYLSWTWKYTIHLVQDALSCWLQEMCLESDGVFLYMCFFVNNQYRILFEKDGVGSSNLEHVFEDTLTRIGRMVAILDDWYDPTYLTRIWTIFEQFTAIKLGNITVTMVLPRGKNQSLIEQIREGEDGIRHVTQSLCKFQSRHATAFSKEDEENVKALIKATIGFREVDHKIEQFMLNWVGNVVQEHLGMGLGHAMPGYFLALPGLVDPTVAAALFTGTFLTSSSAQTMNQMIEVQRDARMKRTAMRPLPSGQLSLTEAAGFATGSGLVGLGVLAVGTTPPTAAVATLTMATYAAVYTPLKVRSPYNTHVGAISGSLPTLMGFTAALGTGLASSQWLAPAMWIFGMQTLWQMPHFYALAWLHRADYIQGGYKMFPLSDATGVETAAMSKPYLAALCALPWAMAASGAASWMLPVGAALPSAVWWHTLQAFERSPRRFFLGSLSYLITLLGLLTAYARVEKPSDDTVCQTEHQSLEPAWRVQLRSYLLKACPHEQASREVLGTAWQTGGARPVRGDRWENLADYRDVF